MKTVYLRAQGENKTLNSTQRVNEMYILLQTRPKRRIMKTVRLRAQGGNGADW